MQQRILGRTGLAVGTLSFGGLFASSLGPGFDESKRAVHKALDLGVNLFDTAPAYANSEEILGRILADINELTPSRPSSDPSVGRPRPIPSPGPEIPAKTPPEAST